MAKRKIKYFILATLGLCFLSAAAAVKSAPLGLPPVPWPKDNPYTEKKAELGRLLFFDKRLSSDGTIACASCHSPSHGFSDPSPLSTGVDGRKGVRHAPTIINAAYLKKLFWDGRADSLELQCLGPLSNPLEMTLDEDPHIAYQNLRERICSVKGYRKLFKEAFGTEECSTEQLEKAIATFERTILSGNSRYDKYLAGDKKALTAEEIKGWGVFNKSRCGACHGGALFSDGKFYNIGVGMDRDDRDLGRFRITKEEKDWGTFKVPMLREIAQTGPYMHDGSMQTLEEVIDFYDKGGTPNEHLDPLIKPLHLSAEDKKALIAFLLSLHGEGWQQVQAPTHFPE